MPKKSQKGLPGPVGPRVPKKSKESLKSLSLALFRGSFDLFDTFLALRADRPETTFLRLFGNLGLEGPALPVTGRYKRKSLCSIILPEVTDAPLLRGPVAILFISRDTLSDSIAKCFRACFPGGIAQVSRDMLQNGVSH